MADLLDQVHAATQGDLLDQVHANQAVKPGTSDDDIIKGLGFDPAVIKASPRYQEAVKQHGSGLSYMVTDPAEHPQLQAWRNAPVVAQVEDVGAGAHDMLSGLVQLARHGAGKLGMLSDADVQYGDLVDRVRKQDYLHNVRQGNASKGLEMLGNILMPVPGGPVMKGDGLGAKVINGIVQGGAAAAAQPVDSGSPDSYTAEKLKQVATGAAVGGAIPAAIGTGVKVYNAATKQLPPEAGAVILAGKEHGVRTSYGDVTGSAAARKAEVAMEQIPGVGTGGFRAAQQTEAKAAAGNIQKGLYNDFMQTSPEAFDDVVKASEAGDQRARNLVEKIQNAGNDPDKTLQASIGLADFRTRQTATDLYDKVADLVDQNKLGEVPLPSAQKAIRASLSELKAAKLPNTDVQKLLETIGSSTSPKPAATPNPFPEGTALWRNFQANRKTQPAGNDYNSIRGLLSDLGDRIRTYYDGNNAIIGEKGVGYLERVRNALQTDLSQFAEKSGVPDVQDAGRAADEYYKTARVPFKDGMLAQAAVTSEPDQIFQSFIKAGKGDRAQKFYDALDAKGKSSVRYQMVANAVNDATNAQSGTFSPAKFFTSMDKLNDAYGVFFQGADKWQMDGFKNLMAHVTRAGSFAENPPTGQRVIPFLLGGGAVGAAVNPEVAKAAALMGGTVAMAKSLLTTPAGRNFLVAGSSLKPGSPAMQSLVDRMMKDLPAAGARAVNQPQQ